MKDFNDSCHTEARFHRNQLCDAVVGAVNSETSAMGEEAFFRKREGIGFRADRKSEVRKHSGFKPMIRVRDIRANLDGAGRHIDLRFDEIDFTRKLLISEGGDLQAEGLARMDSGSIAFGDADP